MQYQVKLVQFSGPLDLLLQLIERSQLEVTQIDLAQITRQYLGYLSSLDDLEPTDLNWFIDLASRLMHLKSSALLPTFPGEEPDQELEDLARQLEEFGRYQLAARHLSERFTSRQQCWERPNVPLLQPDRLPTPAIEWKNLETAFLDALSKLPPPPTVRRLSQRTISLAVMTARVRSLVQSLGQAKLSQLLNQINNRHEIVVLFLALLELIKTGYLVVNQADQFDDINLIMAAS